MEHEGDKGAEGRKGGDHTVIVPPGGGRVGEQPGDSIGPYRLLAMVGEGGFGTVWMAERRAPYVQRVALKIIKPGMDSRAVIARFEQERQALAVMDHPNVAKVLDGGITPLGRPYFVMELVKGEPITEFCDKHRQTIRERLEMFIPVCEAVQHAHMKGIIHRDLKPSNILVSFMEAGGLEGRGGKSEGGHGSGTGRGVLVKVIDFGVAKAISHTLTDKTIFTEHGQIIGTPEYMSPEQAEMGAVDIDTRTDVYSLGVVLYELLTGALPFDPSALRSKGYNEIQRIIREVDPPKPSTRLTSLDLDQKDMPPGTTSAADIARLRHARLGELVRELRRELDWVPLMAMRKDRRERYQSALAVAEDIRNYLRGEALVAGPESAWYRTRKFVKRHRVGVGATAGLMVLLAGFGVVSYYQYRETAAAKGRADESAAAARRDAYAANIAAAGASVELGNVGEALRRLTLCAPELRGWEWGHLKWRADPTSAAADAESPVESLLVTAEGEVLVRTDRAASLWPRTLGAARLKWGRAEAGLALSESDQPQMVAVSEDLSEGFAMSDRTIPAPELFVIRRGEPARKWVLEGWGAGPVITMGTGGLALVGWPLDCKLIDTTARVVASMGPGACAWCQGGERIVQFSAGVVRLRDGRTGEVLSEGPVPFGYPTDPQTGAAAGIMHLSSDEQGHRLAASYLTGIYLHDLTTMVSERVSAPAGFNPVISADGALLMWAVGNTLHVRDTGTARTRMLALPGGAITAVAPSRAGRSVFVGAIDGALRRIDLEQDSPLDWGSGAFGEISDAWGGPYDSVVSIAGDGSVRAGSVIDLDGMKSTEFPDWPLFAWAEHGAGEAVFADSSGNLQCLDLASGKARQVHLAPADLGAGLQVVRVEGVQRRGDTVVAEVVVREGGRVLAQIDPATGSASVLWRPEKAREAGQIVIAHGPGSVLSASLAVRDVGVMAVWAAAGGKARVLSLAHGASAMAFDRAGKRLGVGCYNGTVIVVDELSGGPARELKGMGGNFVRSVAFTPDGARLLTGNDDGAIIVWDVASGEQLVSLNMGSPVLHLCFPNGEERGVAVMQNGSVRYLGVRP